MKYQEGPRICMKFVPPSLPHWLTATSVIICMTRAALTHPFGENIYIFVYIGAIRVSYLHARKMFL